MVSHVCFPEERVSPFIQTTNINHKIDFEEIRRWSEVEKQLELFESIRKELEGKI